MVKLSLAGKLMVVIGATLLSLISISAVTVNDVRGIARSGERLFNVGLPNVRFAGDARADVARMAAILAIAGRAQDSAQLASLKNELAGLTGKLATRLEAHANRKHQSEGDAPSPNGTLMAALSRFKSEAAKAFGLARSNNLPEALEAFNGPVASAQSALADALKTQSERIDHHSAGLVEEMKAKIAWSNTFVMGLAMLLSILVSVIGIVTVFAAFRSINDMANVTGRLAAGDLTVEVPGANREDEIGDMARALEKIRTIGVVAARAQASLDDASSPMFLIDTERKVIFVNKAMGEVVRQSGADLATELPGFDGEDLIDQSFDGLQNVETFGAAGIDALTSSRIERMRAGGRTIDIIASPVFNDGGERLGSVIEWNDKTAQVRIEGEIAEIVAAAGDGDFSRKLSEHGDGFLLDLSRSINEMTSTVDRGLNETVAVVSAIAGGDQSRRMRGEYRGSFLELKDNVNKMGDRLGSIASGIVEVTNAVQRASQEIGAGVSDLSVRTEHQASSLEETTASMEELSGTVRQNASNAREASDVAEAANRAAIEGGEIAARAIIAMEKIEQSSQRINHIVGLIQEIASQTNLLALNAAVEAARAGDAGKGFAVVANEVRALAQRASQASKDIEGLIATSGKQVEHGVDLVKRAGGSLEEIVASMNQVADHVSEIARASEEQSLGIDQVSTAVTNMDEVTQQNASLVEETNAALTAAQSQIADLRELVAFFRTDQKATRAAPSVPDNQVHRMQRSLTRAAGTLPVAGNVALALDDDGDEWDAF